MKWQQGRLNANYQKLVICNFGFFDINLIKILTGTQIPWHTDPIIGKRHYRLNIDLVKPKVGGHFIGKSLWKLPRITLIRPDIHLHKVTEVFKGHSLILSIGVAIGTPVNH